jgi:hypothetical protein
VDDPILGADSTVIRVIADAAVPTVALGISCTIFQCDSRYKVFGLLRLFDAKPIFRNHHHPTPSDEG